MSWKLKASCLDGLFSNNLWLRLKVDKRYFLNMATLKIVLEKQSQETTISDVTHHLVLISRLIKTSIAWFCIVNFEIHKPPTVLILGQQIYTKLPRHVWLSIQCNIYKSIRLPHKHIASSTRVITVFPASIVQNLAKEGSVQKQNFMKKFFPFILCEEKNVFSAI